MLTEPVFVAQIEPRENVEKEEERADLNWNEKEECLPHWNWCGICCVRMIILGLGREAPSLPEMYQVAFDRYGVFRMVDGHIQGAFHRQLAEYIQGEFNLSAVARRGLSPDDVAAWIARGHYVIASVSSEIREMSGKEPKRRNGHLVVVYDVQETEEGRTFVLHNSAGFFRTGTQEAVVVSEKRFAQCFSGNGIIVSV